MCHLISNSESILKTFKLEAEVYSLLNVMRYKGVYPQSDGRLAMAFNEYISMHRKCLSICGYTFSCNRVHSLKWLSTESAILGF